MIVLTTPSQNAVPLEHHQSPRLCSKSRSIQPTFDSMRAPAPRPILCHAAHQSSALKAHYWQYGYCHLPTRLPVPLLDRIQHVIDERVMLPGEFKTQTPDKLHHRNAHLDAYIPEVKALLSQPCLLKSITAILDGTPVLVRSTLIDKPPGCPWHVQWHQDKSPLAHVPKNRHLESSSSSADEQAKTAGNRFIAVRIYLDLSDGSNGGLQVIPGSHTQGLLNAADFAQACLAPSQCLVQPAGIIMFMHPYIIHSSAPNKSDTRRRVIHCEFTV